jgi:hypothetical protein
MFSNMVFQRQGELDESCGFEDDAGGLENEIDINSSIRIACMRSFGSRVAGTIIVGVGWLAFILLWLAFYAGDFDFWQNLAVFFGLGDSGYRHNGGHVGEMGPRTGHTSNAWRTRRQRAMFEIGL